MTPSILVVDDKQDLARGVALVLGELGGEIRVAHTAEAALELLAQRPADLVFTDVKMPGMDGHALLEAVRERWPRTRVILFTGFATVETAVQAMKQGAYDYLTKPFDNDELLLIARRAWKELCDEDEIARLRAELDRSHRFHGIVSRDARMVPVIETIRRVAPTAATVLVSGESGTGKELVARAIHAESPRAPRPFVAFNAAALPETLAEAELFGAKKGAYTGCDRDRKGLFVDAHGGTVLIDEVASMPPSLQGKLLRVIQEREVVPLGSSIPVPVDVRLIAATNVEPSQLLHGGVLRQDLYYRLAVVRIVLPPLRERVDDVPLLAALFLDRFNETAGMCKRLAPAALRILCAHDWPGNVRELQNVIERAAVMSRADEIGGADVRLEDDGPESVIALETGYEAAKRDVVERFQRRYVQRLLGETGGNLAAAARQAGITRAALHRIVKRLGIAARDEGEDEDDVTA
jgi:two-component system response regulator HydG